MKKTASILKFCTFILGLMLTAMFMTSCGDDEVSGCTDAAADNYNSAATVSDNSCEYGGCMDPEAENYDENANVEGEDCIYPQDKFLADYFGTLACPGPLGALLNTDSLPFNISAGFGDKSSVLINLQGAVPVSFEGTASGNDITISTSLLDLPIDLTGDGIPEMVDLDVGGTITLDGNNNLGGTVSITVVDPIP